MKVLIAFIYFFSSILVPIGLCFLGVTLAPEKTAVNRESLLALAKGSGLENNILPDAVSKEPFSYPGALNGTAIQYKEGSVRILFFRDKIEAAGVFKIYAKERSEGSGVHQRSGPDYFFYSIPERGVAGRIEHLDEVIIHAEAHDPEAASKLVMRSGIVYPNPKANWMTEVFRTDQYLYHLIIAFLIYAAIQLRLWNRVGSWAAKVDPEPGIMPVSEDELVSRLLSINDADLPFQVIKKRGGKLEATWRLANAKWAGIATLNKVTELRVIQLRLDDRGKVCRALDIGRSVRKTVDGLEMGFSLTGFIFRGIIFKQWEYEVQYGITIKDGKIDFGKVYEYKFDHDELKGIIVETVIKSGWEYRPVLFISKILGG
jgi:hypothetical protein